MGGGLCCLSRTEAAAAMPDESQDSICFSRGEKGESRKQRLRKTLIERKRISKASQVSFFSVLPNHCFSYNIKFI